MYHLVLHLFDLSSHVNVHILLPGGGTLVVHLLSSTEGYLDLDQVALEVDGGRYKGKALFVDLPLELLDLLLMGKQPSVSHRVMVVEVSMGVGLDGKTYQRQGVIADCHVAV